MLRFYITFAWFLTLCWTLEPSLRSSSFLPTFGSAGSPTLILQSVPAADRYCILFHEGGSGLGEWAGNFIGCDTNALSLLCKPSILRLVTSPSTNLFSRSFFPLILARCLSLVCSHSDRKGLQMAAISACIDSWNWEDLLVSGPVPFSSPVPSIGNQTLPSLFRSTSRPRLPFSLSSSPRFHLLVSQTASRHSSRASFAPLLADSSRVIRPAFPQGRITLALVPVSRWRFRAGRLSRHRREKRYSRSFPGMDSPEDGVGTRKEITNLPLVCLPRRASSSK